MCCCCCCCLHRFVIWGWQTFLCKKARYGALSKPRESTTHHNKHAMGHNAHIYATFARKIVWHFDGILFTFYILFLFLFFCTLSTEMEIGDLFARSLLWPDDDDGKPMVCDNVVHNSHERFGCIPSHFTAIMMGTRAAYASSPRAHSRSYRCRHGKNQQFQLLPTASIFPHTLHSIHFAL